jgi:hypothetical protein
MWALRTAAGEIRSRPEVPAGYAMRLHHRDPLDLFDGTTGTYDSYFGWIVAHSTGTAKQETKKAEDRRTACQNPKGFARAIALVLAQPGSLRIGSLSAIITAVRLAHLSLLPEDLPMRSLLAFACALLAAVPLLLVPPPAESACCYFAAKDKDILQPAQKAFLTFDSDKKAESFTVQPAFEGNAPDFGMVIPTPSKPTLDAMPRNFFKHLAVFTILEPMDLSKYKRRPRPDLPAKDYPTKDKAPADKPPVKPPPVKIVEVGLVGSLEYKILEADRADALYVWLKDNKYSYSGDEATLDYYIKKKWLFTVMKIDPMQMKKKPDGSFEGEITPTRFTFNSDAFIYPLKITQISVKKETEALFYVQAAHKYDLKGDFSYQFSFAPMCLQALSFAISEKLTEEEKKWHALAQPVSGKLAERANQLTRQGLKPATLEWAKKIVQNDLDVIEGKARYNREAPEEEVKNLKYLKGLIQKDQFITKFRKVFAKSEMESDLELTRAQINDKDDDLPYHAILPTSPP